MSAAVKIIEHPSFKAQTCICMEPGAGRLIASGRKTETRRTGSFTYINREPAAWALSWQGIDDGCVKVEMSRKGESRIIRCPFGAPGSILTVLEPWHRDGAELYCKETAEDNRFDWESPSMMPMTAARASIRLEAVVCQRFSDMEERNAMAEGVEPQIGRDGYPDNAPHPLIRDGLENRDRQYLAAFFRQWDSSGAECKSRINPWCFAMKLSIYKP